MGLARLWRLNIRVPARRALRFPLHLWPSHGGPMRRRPPPPARDGPQGEAAMAAIGTKPPEQVLAELESSGAGLSEQEADRRRRLYGPNDIPRQGTSSWPAQLLASGGNPLVLLLGALAALSLVSGEAESALIIPTIVIFSVILRFSQEYRSSRAVAALRDLVLNTATVSRPVPAGDRAGQPSASLDPGPSLQEGHRQDVPMRDLVPGDVILLAAGDMVPADVCLLQSKGLYVSQAALTGESLPVEKHGAGDAKTSASSNVLDLESLCFLCTAVVSGAARAVVVQTGGRTILGSMAEGMGVPKSKTGFDKGVNDVSGLLLRFMLVMAPSVFLINGLLKGNWGEAFFFALSVAMGLTPEMLPMIVTANLARGAIAMSKQQVIVKKINSIQCLGAMETLCTDKTGTLTQDHIALKFPLDIFGRARRGPGICLSEQHLSKRSQEPFRCGDPGAQGLGGQTECAPALPQN